MQYSDYVMLGKAYHPQQVTHIQKHADDEVAFTLKTKNHLLTPHRTCKADHRESDHLFQLTTDRTYRQLR